MPSFRPRAFRRLRIFANTRLRLANLEDRITPALFTVTSTADIGAGSLRQAVASALAAGGADTIDFAPALSGQTIRFNSEIVISDTVGVTIDGGTNSITLSGDKDNNGSADARLFSISNNAKLTIASLTLTKGNGKGATAADTGGAVFNAGTLIITGSAVINSVAAYGGAALNSSGSASIINCTISGNTSYSSIDSSGSATITGTTIANNGGTGVYSTGATASISNCTISANTGRGIDSTGNLTVTSCTVADNKASGIRTRLTANISNSVISGNNAGVGDFGSGSDMYGGGVFCGGSTTITNCIISSNAAAQGGGVFNYANLSTASTVTISGTAIVNNVARNTSTPANSFGGGVLNDFRSTMTLIGCTISSNTSGGVGGGILDRRLSFWPSTFSMTNSSLIGNVSESTNSGGLCVSSALPPILVSSLIAGNGLDIDGTLDPTSHHNLIGNATSAGGLLNGVNGNIVGNGGSGNIPLHSLVAPVGNYGGATLTHALAPGSLAINAGANPLGLVNDQRGAGFSRVLGGSADIGAFEHDPAIPLALLAPVPLISSPSGATLNLIVTYSDDVAISGSSLGVADISVRTPTGSVITPQSFSVDFPGDGPSRVVTYTMPVPGGQWDQFDNGLYTVVCNAGEVADTSGNSVVGELLGTMAVALPYVVDSPTDGIDGNYGPGQFTLREALALANASPSTANTITFDTVAFAVPTTISLTGQALSITATVAVIGPGASRLTVSGQNTSGVFSNSSFGASLAGMSMTKGNAGGILNLGQLSISDCMIFQNTGSNIGLSDFNGGGLTNRYGGVMTIAGCTITGNSSLGGGGGIRNSGRLTIFNSTISGNSALDSSYQGGGGILSIAKVFQDSFGQVALIVPADLELIGCTITGNQSSQGGGVRNLYSQLNVANSTVTGNIGGGIRNNNYNYYDNYGTYGSAILLSSIIANNGSDVAGDVVSPNSKFNLIGNASSAGGLVHGQNGNIVGNAGSGTIPIATILGPLADNGGTTKTHALIAGSPAINKGSNPNNLVYDQRGTGFGRVSGGLPDIGATEYHFPPTVSSVTFGDGTNQRSLVKQIVVNFSEPVTFMGSVASAFTVQRTGPGGTIGDVTLSASPVTGTASSVTISFSGDLTEYGSLADGVYNFLISAAQVSNPAGLLDGNNDGIAGGSYVVIGSAANSFYRLFGDANGDRKVDLVDFGALRTAMGQASSIFDFDNKGFVYLTDFDQFRMRFNLVV